MIIKLKNALVLSQHPMGKIREIKVLEEKNNYFDRNNLEVTFQSQNNNGIRKWNEKAGFLLDEKGKTSFFSSLFGFPVYSPIGIKMIS